MTTTVRYEPWSIQRDLINEVNRFFERASNADSSTGATADWMPAVDIEEHADKFVLYADLPGVDPKTIDITLEKGLLISTAHMLAWEPSITAMCMHQA